MSKELTHAPQLPKSGDPDVESAIIEAVRSLRYGSVEVTIHNAKVVQVERKEKLRFTSRPGT